MNTPSPHTHIYPSVKNFFCKKYPPKKYTHCTCCRQTIEKMLLLMVLMICQENTSRMKQIKEKPLRFVFFLSTFLTSHHIGLKKLFTLG